MRAHIGDLLSRFTCESAMVLAVLEVECKAPDDPGEGLGPLVAVGDSDFGHLGG